MENTLKHHGIPNQKWGERNGPPYPLSRAEHKKVVNSGDLKTLEENITEFKDWEIEKTLKRFDYNQKIKTLRESEKAKKGENRIKKLINNTRNASDVLHNLSSAAGSGISLYNSIAKTMNSLFDGNMKTIGDKKSKNKDGNNDKKTKKNKSLLNKIVSPSQVPDWKKAGYSSKESYEHAKNLTPYQDPPTYINIYNNGKKYNKKHSKGKR